MLPSFCEPPGFYVLSGAIFVFTLWLYARRRLSKIKNNNLVLEKRIAERTREMEFMLNELIISKHELLERNRIQQRLLTAISHDIKSPLKFLEMVARQFLENLKNGADDRATSVRVAGLLQEGSYRLYLLTDNLLQYLKLYSTEGIIVTQPVHLHSLVEEKRTLFADIAASGGNKIRNQISSDLEVNSDVTLLNVILHNLLDNAVKVTKDGLIIIDGKINESNVIIQVSDTGAGMRAHLVEWCNDTQQLRSNVGVTGGLGLIIVKELVHLIGGKLEVRSQPGNGTVIQLVLPS
jgi:signal transduction histidine kinase